MLDTLTWRDLWTTEIQSEIDELRVHTVQVLIILATGGYLAWHLGTLTAFSTLPDKPDVLPYWLCFPIVLGYLAGSYLLVARRVSRAIELFLGVSALILALVSGVLQTAVPLRLYPLLTLAATALLQPLAGLVIGAASVALLILLHQAGFLGFLAPAEIVLVGIGEAIAVIVAWALGRDLVIAVKWALDSYARALKSAEEARGHRAELYRALKQLDNAYYRLERANAALELAWRAAEVAERSKSEFVTNISHELRTPLNLIVGFSEMILTSPESYGVPLPAPYRGDLNAIYRSARHLLTLTEDVLDLARVGIGRLALAREPVDLAEVIEDACGIVREYVAAKGLTLEVRVPADLPILTVDRLRIRQVLLNLLTNAARFTQRGGITISAVPQGRFILVTVADTGQGIAPSDLDRIFEEFYHVESGEAPRRHRLGGIGLGLPLSKRLIELHGGEMGVESTLGVGTTFWFTLPIAPAEGSAEAETWHPLRMPGLAGRPERILVLAVDDRRLAQFLEHHLRGYRVLTAPDLADAARLAVEVRATAILADAEGDAGPLAIEPPVPVICLPVPHGARLAAMLGVAAYLVKPITRTELREVITRLGRPIHRVLIVDDDPRFVRLITRYLHWIGRGEIERVTAARSGREALAQLASEPPDLVLLDLVMPDGSGNDVLAAMARDPATAAIPVIVISAHEPGEGQMALRGPLVLHKPEGFQQEEILGMVEGLLGALRPPRTYLDRSAVPPSDGRGGG